MSISLIFSVKLLLLIVDKIMYNRRNQKIKREYKMILIMINIIVQCAHRHNTTCSYHYNAYPLQLNCRHLYYSLGFLTTEKLRRLPHS